MRKQGDWSPCNHNFGFGVCVSNITMSIILAITITMAKGAIILGIGGDNSCRAVGTFYEV